MRDMRRQRWGCAYAHRSGQAVRASRPPFPTLARRAGSLRACRRLGFWLPRGLSYRTARSARHGAAAGRTVLCRAREARVEGGHKYHPAAHLLAPHRVHPSSHSLVSSPLQANHPSRSLHSPTLTLTHHVLPRRCLLSPYPRPLCGCDPRPPPELQHRRCPVLQLHP